MEVYKSKVYIQTDENNNILRCEGGYTISNIQNEEEWILIDEGEGDRYNLCQSHYFDRLYTEDGIPRYKWDGEKAVLRAEEELAADREALEYGDLESAKERKQEENKQALAKFLNENPIVWQDGCAYGVTEEDQTELALNMNQYQLQVAAGIPDAKLEWHPRHAACRAFTLEEYTGLILAVKNFVYPYVQQCQVLKEQIYNAKTVDELKAVEIVYEKADKGIV